MGGIAALKMEGGMSRSWLCVVLAGGLTACTGASSSTVTMYRNSPIDHAMRIHWATFDARDGQAYNWANCGMAARILNANVSELAKREGKPRDKALGFWCEAGPYKQDGHGATVPTSFESAYPTDA